MVKNFESNVIDLRRQRDKRSTSRKMPKASIDLIVLHRL